MLLVIIILTIPYFLFTTYLYHDKMGQKYHKITKKIKNFKRKFVILQICP